jgi:replicative DNA helicase
MTTSRATIVTLPPRPNLDLDDTGFADPGAEPWVTTGADLVAYLLADAAGSTPVLVATGNPDLDNPHGGLAPGTLTAVIAAPGPAATAAMAAAAHHAAYQQHQTTLFYPLRSTAAAMAAVLADTHAQAAPESDGIAGAVDDLRNCPLYVALGTPVTVTRILADALDDDMDPPQFIVIDAVALLHPAGAARDLKHLALELNIPVLCATTVTPGADANLTAADAPADLAATADTIIAISPQPPRHTQHPTTAGRPHPTPTTANPQPWARR